MGTPAKQTRAARATREAMRIPEFYGFTADAGIDFRAGHEVSFLFDNALKFAPLPMMALCIFTDDLAGATN